MLIKLQNIRNSLLFYTDKNFGQLDILNLIIFDIYLCIDIQI